MICDWFGVSDYLRSWVAPQMTLWLCEPGRLDAVVILSDRLRVRADELLADQSWR